MDFVNTYLTWYTIEPVNVAESFNKENLKYT